MLSRMSDHQDAPQFLAARRTDQRPDEWVRSIGDVFATFDARTQDSGNVSYGVSVGGDRYFIKTAGASDGSEPYLSFSEMVDLLRNAVRISRSVTHPALPRLHAVVESSEGPMLIYDWACGELVRTVPERIRQLPVSEVVDLLGTVFDVHAILAAVGWIAVDFYDGSMIYHFERRDLRLVDIDHYRHGPFTNQMGRMFGSSRFMAPEEFEAGAAIDQQTNVFTMGRTVAVLLSDGTLGREPFRGNDAQYEIVVRACNADRDHRHRSLGDFPASWLAAGTAN